MKYKLAIINSSSFGKIFTKHYEKLAEIAEIDRILVKGDMHGKELATKLKDYNMVISSVTPFFDEEFFEYKKDLLIISRHGIGYNNVDVKAAEKTGTYVAIVPPLVEQSAVAENAVTNLLAVMRRLPQARDAVLSNNWVKRADFIGNGVENKTVGIIGCGNIGSKVAEILHYGFNTKVLICDPKQNIEWEKKHGFKHVEINELLEKADIISMNASLNDTSFHILSTPQFNKMKKGVYITNTARGALIDEDSMCKALESGIVRSYATDVMVDEPAFNDHPYFKYDNVLITCHTSAYTYECLKGMGDKCVDDIVRVTQNKKPNNMVTKL